MRYLKIKDNVDLKKLGRFGFRLNDDEEYELSIDKDNIRTIIIVEYDRRILAQSNAYIIQNLGILYDLIKADMVEVVEKKEGN